MLPMGRVGRGHATDIDVHAKTIAPHDDAGRDIADIGKTDHAQILQVVSGYRRDRDGRT